MPVLSEEVITIGEVITVGEVRVGVTAGVDADVDVVGEILVLDVEVLRNDLI